MVDKVSLLNHSISYAKRTGLRSMQHITGIEREIIEAHKSELPHEIWGNQSRLLDWVKQKIEKLINGDYPSNLLERDVVENSRNDLVKAWGELVKTDLKTSKKPFLQLEIMKFVTQKLQETNKALAPVLRIDAFQDALFAAQKTGKSFKKIYTNLLKNTRYHQININEENVNIDGVRGTWYNFRTLDESESVKKPLLASRLTEFLTSISQGSDWCIRSKHNVLREYIGTKFHIFVDDKGMPQLCLAAVDDTEKTFQCIKGKEQYNAIPKKFKKILLDFIQKHKLTESTAIDNGGCEKAVLDFCN